MGSGSAGTGWASYLPLLIFAGLMAWRFRNLQKARPLRLPMLWFLPFFVTGAVILAMASMPPTGMGWLAVAGGFAIGGALGIQRSRLMRLHVEGEGDDARVMVRQSPIALVLILGVFAARRIVLPNGFVLSTDHTTTTALLITDGVLGMVVGLVVLSRFVLWKRAKALGESHTLDAR